MKRSRNLYHEQIRNDLEHDIQVFLRNGGVIEQVPMGTTGQNYLNLSHKVQRMHIENATAQKENASAKAKARSLEGVDLEHYE